MRLFKDKSGATSIEYAVLAAGVSVVIIVAAGLLDKKAKRTLIM